MSSSPTGPSRYVPARVPHLHEGRGAWANGFYSYDWSLHDVSRRHRGMGTSGHGVFLVARASSLDRSLFDELLWIQYLEVVYRGEIYVPPATVNDPFPLPWRGIHRYRNGLDCDGLPYVALPDEQRRINQGRAFEGRVRSLYSPNGAETIAVGWGSSGGMTEMSQFSVLSLIGRDHRNKEWRLGSLSSIWSVDSSGVFSFGARNADAADCALWLQRLGEGYPQYLAGPYGGDWVG